MEISTQNEADSLSGHRYYDNNKQNRYRLPLSVAATAVIKSPAAAAAAAAGGMMLVGRRQTRQMKLPGL